MAGSRGPWNDLVGVFYLEDEKASSQQSDVSLPANRYMEQFAVAPLFDSDARPEVEVINGKAPYLETLRQIHQIIQPRHYLEIGVRKGNSLSLSCCPSVAVDPDSDIRFELNADQQLFNKTSDDFFREDATELFNEIKPDLIFIDGMHLFEFALRDFINAERYSLTNTLIVIDDIYPNHPVQAERQRQSRVWTGDIWKLHDCLKTVRPDLVLIPIDTVPAGLLLVAGLNPMNRILSNQYNPLVRKYRELSFSDTDLELIERHDALMPDDSRIEEILKAIKVEQSEPKDDFNVRLKLILKT